METTYKLGAKNDEALEVCNFVRKKVRKEMDEMKSHSTHFTGFVSLRHF